MQRSLQMSVSLKTSLRQVILAVLAELQGWSDCNTYPMGIYWVKIIFGIESFSLLRQDDVERLYDRIPPPEALSSAPQA